MRPECILKLKEQFKGEQSAFSGYKAIKDMTDDEFDDMLQKLMEERRQRKRKRFWTIFAPIL